MIDDAATAEKTKLLRPKITSGTTTWPRSAIVWRSARDATGMTQAPTGAPAGCQGRDGAQLGKRPIGAAREPAADAERAL